MKVLTVPNWSFGRDKTLLRAFRDELESRPVEIHFLAGDVDHNRTVSAFSGEQEDVRAALLSLCELAMPAIDLNRHVGCHPRIGALDVCPFIPWTRPEDEAGFQDWIEGTAAEVADRFAVPVFLYERSERGRHSRRLPDLRKLGFGGMMDRDLDPDFGPTRIHPLNGATVMGWRDFLIALNINIVEDSPVFAQNLAAKIRTRRRDGDPLFDGVRALGFYLSSRRRSQLSMNLTKPDLTFVDQVLQWGFDAVKRLGTRDDGAELIGVIRAKDMEHATLVLVKPEQVVEIR